MGRKVKQLKNYSTEQVETLIASDENYRIGMKLYAVLQITRGYSSRSLEAFFKTSFKQICNWADRFDMEGIEGLRIKPGRGRRARLTEGQKHQLKAELLKSPEESGYQSTRWSVSLAREHIREKYMVEYGPAAIYNLIRGMNVSFSSGRDFRGCDTDICV